MLTCNIYSLILRAHRNILKDLENEHIVRYHDRYVDREAGILYILMEYCGGGDLSSIVKQAQKHNRLVPEDTIWHYFMQILLALQHCHHPPCQGKDGEGRERRPQILHRDLKPDNGKLYTIFGGVLLEEPKVVITSFP